MYIYSQSHLGWHFRKLKAQSSNVSFATFQWKETFELWALSFETAFKNVTPTGIGCIYIYHLFHENITNPIHYLFLVFIYFMYFIHLMSFNFSMNFIYFKTFISPNECHFCRPNTTNQWMSFLSRTQCAIQTSTISSISRLSSLPMNVISVTNPMRHPHINYFIYFKTFISLNECHFCHEPNAPSPHQLFHLFHVFHEFHLPREFHLCLPNTTNPMRRLNITNQMTTSWRKRMSQLPRHPNINYVISVTNSKNVTTHTSSKHHLCHFCHEPKECHNSQVIQTSTISSISWLSSLPMNVISVTNPMNVTTRTSKRWCTRSYGVATISRLLKIISLFCKRAL